MMQSAAVYDNCQVFRRKPHKNTAANFVLKYDASCCCMREQQRHADLGCADADDFCKVLFNTKSAAFACQSLSLSTSLGGCT